MKQEWLEHPDTVDLIHNILTAQTNLQDQWANKEFVSEDPLQIAVKNAQALGFYEGLQNVLDFIHGEDE